MRICDGMYCGSAVVAQVKRGIVSPSLMQLVTTCPCGHVQAETEDLRVLFCMAMVHSIVAMSFTDTT